MQSTAAEGPVVDITVAVSRVTLMVVEVADPEVIHRAAALAIGAAVSVTCMPVAVHAAVEINTSHREGEEVVHHLLAKDVVVPTAIQKFVLHEGKSARIVQR